MKLFIVLGLCAIAIANRHGWNDVPKEDIRESYFRTQREYLYRYNGQISTGLYEGSNELSASRIQADVSFVFTAEKSVLMRIVQVRFGSVNRDLPEPRVIQPFEVFEHKEMDEDHKKLLLLPLRFRYVDGLISEIEFDNDDKPWSENIKRAILNMLQVNIKKNARKDSEEHHKMKNIEDIEEIEEIQTNSDFFRTQEKTLEGDCETLYTFSKPKEDERTLWKISKSVNFEKCRERVDIRYNYRFGKQCDEWNRLIKEKEPTTTSSTVFNYDITGNKDKFLVTKVDVKSHYVFAPLSKQDAVAVTFVTGKLELIKVKEDVEGIELQGGRKEKQTLLYSPEREIKVERFYMRGDEELDNEHPFKQIHNKYDLIEQTILRMLHVTSDKEIGMESDVTHQFARLVDLLRMCSKPELRRVHEELYENPDKFEEKKLQQVRDILIDALAIAGTKNTVEHLVEKIETGRMPVVKAVKALQSLVNIRIISKEQIEHVFGLCNKETTKRSPVLRQTCLLTVGGMINGLCKENKDFLAVEYTNEKHCPKELKERYLQDLMEIFKTAETRYEKVLALKTLGNAGIDLGVFELEKIIYNRNLERIIRSEAIEALRQLHDVMPRKIQKILLPLFNDRLEHPEIRMKALVHVMHTTPSRPILDQIAHTLFNERSRQVQSFTYSMMKTFSNSKIPCEKKLAEDLLVSLRLVRVPIESWIDSKYVHMPWYHHHHKMGLSLDLASVFTKDSVLPRDLLANLDTHLWGQWTKQSLHIGFTQYNIEQFFEKMIKNTEDKSLEDIVVRGRRSTSFRPIDLLRNLYEKLNVKSRREESNMALDIYFRRNGLDFAIIPFDEETIPETLRVMREGKIDLTRLEHLLGQGFRFNTHFGTYFYEISRRIPTSIGLPLIVAGKMPTVLGITGELKIELTPTKSERLDGAKLIMNIRPAIATTHITQIYFWNPVLFSGLKIIQSGKLDLPINVVVDLNVDKKVEMTYKIKVPEEKRQIMWMHTRVMTVTSSWPKNVKKYVEPKEKTVHLKPYERQLKTVEKTFGEKLMGVRFSVRGQYHENPLRVLGQTPVDFLLGENIFEVYMEPGENVPTHILAKFIFDLVKQDKMEKPQFERFYSETSEKELFEVEIDDDEYENPRIERRLRNDEDLPRDNSRLRVRRDSESSEEEWESRRILRNNEDERTERRWRNPQKERERHEEFSRYLQEYKPEGGYKLRMEVKLETIGSSVDRKANVEIVTACDERIRYCRLKVNGRRTPLFENERNDWTVKVDMETLYPQQVRSLQELKEKKHREFNAHVKCEWGSQKKQQFHMKIQGEQSQEQRRWMNTVEGKSKNVERYNEILRATQLNQYKVCVDYQFEPYLKNYVYRIFNVLKSWNLWSSTVTPVQNEERRIFAKFTIDPRTHQYLTMKVECPTETVEMKDLRLPVKVSPLMLNIHRHETPVRSLRHFVKKTVSERRAECKVSDRWVNTFDDTEIKVPITTCYSVLAKDCTSDQPRFAVLMKKVRKNSEQMKMKIMDEERVIEIVNREDVMEVTVDGRRMDDEERLQSMGISRKDEMVVVELEDVLVRFDGRTASVKVSPLYKNGQCGICGHYDDEKDDELRKADNELTTDVEEYHRSYFSNDEECDIEESIVNEKKNYRHELSSFEDEFSDYNEETTKNTKRPLMRTKVIEYNNELCFSTKPVPVCPKNTYMNDENTTDKKVSFACLSRSKHETSKLARRARTEVVNMDNYKPSFVDNVQIPQECLVF